METRTYTERSNARRAARAAGLDPDSIITTEDGFEVCFPPVEPEPSPIKQAVNAAVERGLTPKQFVAEAEKVADALDTIPDFCKLTPEQRKEVWDRNPPRRAASSQPKDTITMPKTTAKPKAKRGEKGADKNATLLSMLTKGATVEALCKALDWLPHTLRARISRLAKPKSKGGEGLKIERARVEKVTSYRIAS